MTFKKLGDLTIFSKSSKLFFYKNKSLGFGKKFKISKEQSQACCPAQHKNKSSHDRTSEQSLAVTYIALHID